MKMHKSITLDKLTRAVEARMTTLANPGFCIGCGHKQGGCEPDARHYECEACGKKLVFGADELLMEVI